MRKVNEKTKTEALVPATAEDPIKPEAASAADLVAIDEAVAAAKKEEDDSAEIQRDLEEASNEFDRRNKEEYDKIRRQNLENAGFSEGKAGKLLQRIAVPLIVVGALMVWNSFTVESTFEFAPVLLTVLIAVALYCYGLAAILSGARKKAAVKEKLKPILAGSAAILGCAALFVFNKEISNYIFLVLGITVLIADLIYLMGALLFYRKSPDQRNTIVRIVMGSLALCVAVLLVVAHFLSGIELYGQISGIVITAFGSALLAS